MKKRLMVFKQNILKSFWDVSNRILLRNAIFYSYLKSLHLKGKLLWLDSRTYTTKQVSVVKKTKRTEKVLVVINHVLSDWKKTPNLDYKYFESRSVERLTNTISSLLESLDGYELKIIINTVPNKNVINKLPKDILSKVKINISSTIDPMYVGFIAQDIFSENKSKFDWFIYTEDDLVLKDSLILEKLKVFNKLVRDKTVLLLPNRYEYSHFEKRYIDLEWIKNIGNVKNKFRYYSWSQFKLGLWGFSQYLNPHSGFYCLSQKQLLGWLDCGRIWYKKVSYLGPLESAATGSLMEYFTIYQPSPQNLNLLEIKHFESTYTGTKS